MLSLLKDTDEIAREFCTGKRDPRRSRTAAVLGREVGVGGASATGTTRSTDAVNVVLDAVGHVVVDHVADVLDVFRERSADAQHTDRDRDGDPGLPSSALSARRKEKR